MIRLMAVFLFLFAWDARASATFTSSTDNQNAKQNGVKYIQFVMGGEDEKIVGQPNEESVRRSFKSNVVHQYHCYAEAYGGESKELGQSVLVFDLISSGPKFNSQMGNARPTHLKIESTGLDKPQFLNCVKKFWGDVGMIAPAEGVTTEVRMPIKAVLRESHLDK